ncbi:MAG: four helix bundle protein [Dysgonamonadaceae bacterium]|nr:four helix bundle protein [Dysgonamonadaceae bacterium]
MKREFEDQKEWKLSMDLATNVYKQMVQLPIEEYEDYYSISNQIKRTAISIPSKIAAGYSLGGEYLLENLSIARGLLARLETLLILAANVKVLEEKKMELLLKEIESVREEIRI